MTTRRRFLQLSGAALPALAFPSAWADGHVPLGVQIYTLRSIIKKNLPEILKQVRQIGYEQLELAQFLYHHPAKDLRKIIQDCGLTAPSGHFDYKTFSSKFEYAKELGLQWMVLASIPSGEKNLLDSYHRAAVQLNAWGKRAREEGMRVAFHTHDDVFREVNHVSGYDVLLKETDPELVFFELDCYWVAQAGRDPVLLLNQLNKRATMLHLKDRKAGFPPSTDTGPSSEHFTEVGSGTINWRMIMVLAQRIGVEHYFVEQDEPEMSPIESIRISYNYLRKIVE